MKGATMKESKHLEWKEDVTNTFLKTVSAYANYEGGTIEFGRNDKGEIVGLDDIRQACLNIENKINDSIAPMPDYSIQIKGRTIVLEVSAGIAKPYFYKGKAYKRSDTATIEVDNIELKRLALEGANKYYEQLKSEKQDLRFTYLESCLKEILKIDRLSEDILKTLNFYVDGNSYNNAAALFADENDFSGIDIARFGDSINIFLDRKSLVNISVLEQFAEAINTFELYYQYEQIEGQVREKKYLIPADAYREAVANALIHRTWDINSNIRVLMYKDKVEISSPGGLPSGISKEEYLNGRVSVLRNPTLANIFYRLNYVEIFGTGVRRIIESYRDYTVKPDFVITENTITIVLPVVNASGKMTSDEQKLVDVFTKTSVLSSSEMVELAGFNKAKTLRLAQSLIDKGILRREGEGRATGYSLN